MIFAGSLLFCQEGLMDSFNKEVNFALYCKTCEHKDLEGFKSPCNECLEVPVREGTSKPEKYEAIKD
jgi:hypothetical protein